MTKRILITRSIPQVGIDMLRAKGYEVDVNEGTNIPSQKKIISLLKKKSYDVLVSLIPDPIDGAVFDAAPSLKLVSNYASGYDNIDVKEASKRGISVTNAPSIFASDAVAEHTIALMLAIAFRLVEADAFVRKGKYVGWQPMDFVGMDISGKTLGLVGAGHIGERVAQYARGLGMSVIYTDVIRNDRLEKDYAATYVPSVDELLPHADVLSLHVPLFDSTRHLINEARLKLMKPTAFVVNTARGPVIDEQALVQALAIGVIAGAALDVFEHEPAVTKALLKMNNVILTPHIGSASFKARGDMAQIVADNIIDFIEGKIPRNLIRNS